MKDSLVPEARCEGSYGKIIGPHNFLARRRHGGNSLFLNATDVEL